MNRIVLGSVFGLGLAAAAAAMAFQARPAPAIGATAVAASSAVVAPTPVPTSAQATVQPVPVGSTAPLAERRPPVPLLMKPRPTIEVASYSADAPGTTLQADAPGAGEASARSAVEADGYKGVKILGPAANGGWRASALRGATRITVTVDAQGNVAAD